MSENTETWPFQKWLKLAVVHMKISPEEFWDMPVRDWFWLCQTSQNKAISLDDFQSLFEQFPDKE